MNGSQFNPTRDHLVLIGIESSLEIKANTHLLTDHRTSETAIRIATEFGTLLYKKRVCQIQPGSWSLPLNHVLSKQQRIR